MVWETETPPALPNARKEAVKASHRSLVSAYHKLGDFPLLDAGGGDLKEQFDVLPATFLGPPVLLQLPCGHAGVRARAALGVWRQEHLRTSTGWCFRGRDWGRRLGLSGMGRGSPERCEYPRPSSQVWHQPAFCAQPG